MQYGAIGAAGLAVPLPVALELNKRTVFAQLPLTEEWTLAQVVQIP